MRRNRASLTGSRGSTSRRSSLLGYVVTQGLAIVRSRRWQQTLLGIIVLVHVVVGIISLVFGVIYLTLLVYSRWADDIFAMVGLKFNPQAAGVAFVFAAICGLAHVVQACRAIYPTPTNKIQAVRVRINGPHSQMFTVDHRKDASRYCRIRAMLLGLIASCGIRGQHFDAFFLTREVLTIGLQTFQCYRLSSSIVKPSIRNAAISLLVINCVSTPIIHFIGRHWHVLSTRLLCLVLDTLIDLTTSLVMPVMTLLPYFLSFIQSSPKRNSNLLNDAVYVATAHGEMSMVFANSGATCAMLYIPAITLLFSMADLKLLLLHALRRSKALSNLAVIERSPTAVDRSHTSRFQRITHWALFAYGLVVVAFVIATCNAIRYEKQSLCQVHLQPWTADRVACGAVVIDCVHQDVVGSVEEIQSRLEEYDMAMIQVLTIAHCTRLQIPATFQQLSKLLIFEVYNSTMIAWGQEAEIHADFHPEIMTVLIVDVSLVMLGDAIPAALLGNNIPKTLTSLLFVSTYLREIPSGFHLKWPHRLVSLHFNDCGLESLPQRFGELNVAFKLSLSGNRLAFLPPDFFDGSMPQRLNVGDNPVTLPDAGNATGLMLLSMQNTSVDVLPSWVLDASPTWIVGAHSPFCQDMPAWRLVNRSNITCNEVDPSFFNFAKDDWIEYRGLGVAGAPVSNGTTESLTLIAV